MILDIYFPSDLYACFPWPPSKKMVQSPWYQFWYRWSFALGHLWFLGFWYLCCPEPAYMPSLSQVSSLTPPWRCQVSQTGIWSSDCFSNNFLCIVPGQIMQGELAGGWWRKGARDLLKAPESPPLKVIKIILRVLGDGHHCAHIPEAWRNACHFNHLCCKTQASLQRIKPDNWQPSARCSDHVVRPELY